MSTLLADPERAREAGRHGREVAEAIFSVEAFAKRFAAVILDDPVVLDAHSGHDVGSSAPDAA